MRAKPLASVLLILVSASLHGQGFPQLEPFSLTGDVFVADAGNDVILRLQDLTLDGDFNDPGEVAVYYDGSMGGIALSNPTGVAVGPDGTVYVVDSTVRVVLALQDLDLDGTAQGVLEHRIFFDGNPANNGSGIDMTSPQDVSVDALGMVWVATANTSSGTDAILRLLDLGGTFGANDPGEASRYFTPPATGSTGDSIPSDVRIGPGGFIYYLENGSTGAVQKGVWRLHDDVVVNGHCNDPGEASLYHAPPPLGGNPFYFGMCFDASGALFLADNGNDVIWRSVDIDGNLSISTGSPEETLWWNPGTASQVWMVDADSGVAVYAAESQAPDRILRIADDVTPNGNANDPGETLAVYDSAVASLVIANPRSLAFARRPTLSGPTMPSIGSFVTIQVQGTMLHPFDVWFSTGLGMLPFPPHGTVGISVSPPALFGSLYTGVIPAGGSHGMGFLIPNDPQLIGAQLHLQGYSGAPARVQLTNVLSATFAP